MAVLAPFNARYIWHTVVFYSSWSNSDRQAHENFWQPTGFFHWSTTDTIWINFAGFFHWTTTDTIWIKTWWATRNSFTCTCFLLLLSQGWCNGLSTTTKSHNVTLLLPTVAPKVNQHRSHEEQRYILSVSDAATTTGTENIRKRNYTQSHAYFGTSTKLCIAHHPTTSQSPIFSTLAYITPFQLVQPWM